MIVLYTLSDAGDGVTGRLGVEQRGAVWFAHLEMNGQPRGSKPCANRHIAEREVELFRTVSERGFDSVPAWQGTRWSPVVDASVSGETGSGLWWLSFVREEKFAGACVVGPAPTFMGALALSHRLKCNPGGECQGFEVHADAAPFVPADYRNRVLTKAECEAVDNLVCDRLGLPEEP